MKIIVSKTRATLTEPEALTSGMVGKTISLEFSEEWQGLNIIAVFSNGSISKDVVNPQAEAIIPWEVLQEAGEHCEVGFYGYTIVDGAKVLAIPTIYCDLGHISQGADPSNDPTAELSPTVAEQLQADVNDLDERVTYLEEHGGGGGGIPDAPADGKQYARQNGEWTEVQSASGQGWTDEQIDLLESIFGKLVYTDAQGGQFARALIASLRGEEPSEYEVSFADGVLTITKAPATQSGAVLTIN